MQLNGLIPLYRDMKAQGIGRYKFRYQHNHLTFECLFFIDLEPFELVMGCLGHNFAIFLDVEKGFHIEPFINPKETYWALVNALKTHGESNNTFKPVEFFKAFNENVPVKASPDNRATPADIVRYYDNIEEADKLFFCGWLDNNKQGNKVSEDNLEKTRRLIDEKTYRFARKRNLSTRWTHDKSKSIALYLPE